MLESNVIDFHRSQYNDKGFYTGTIVPKDMVKVLIDDERVWVEVSWVGEKYLEGTLRSEPGTFKGHVGDPISVLRSTVIEKQIRK